MMAPSGRLRLGLAAAAALACGDIAAPVRDDFYEWRLLSPTSTPPGIDTLGFHWSQADLPVRVWVEDADNLPDHVARGLEVWESQFLYGEFRGTVVADSTEADVIVRSGSPPSADVSPTRLNGAFAPECIGATDLDVDQTNSQLRLPIRLYLNPGLLPDEPATQRCLALTSIHELGHAIGIFAHSPNPEDIMFSDPAVELPSSLDRSTAETAYHTPATLEAVRP